MTQWRKYVLGCAVGNLLEWYDFILFGFFAQVFSRLFFPEQDPFISLLLTFTVFASGCFIRPVASIVFGHLGDTIGRKRTLIYTIGMITVSTTAMGLLPTYQQVGVWAPCLLVLCRLLQGVAVSGEEMGAAVLLAENAPKDQQALMGGVILSSVYLGLFFGAITVLVIHVFSSSAFLEAWGWRIPFLASSVLGVIALRLRMSAFESKAFEALAKEKKVLQKPVMTAFKSHWREMVRAIALSAILAVAIYLFAVYLPSYYAKIAGFSSTISLAISAAFLLLIGVMVPLFGMMADRFGTKLFMSIGCWGFIVTSYPIFYLLAQHTLLTTLSAEFMLVLCLAFVTGSLLPLIIHAFPADVRYSGSCISFNVSMTIFGSTAPIIALTLQKYFYTEVAPCLYLLLAAVISLIALRFDQWARLGSMSKPLVSDLTSEVCHEV